ncbi:TPA: hypothetical protein RZL14_002825 [Yersinia enterocolitica]|nr:hypothetical protein [Yersinia enterocolitica]ELX2216708.1 hypothetical protein [Yersinia enterocolitica]HDL6524997.1 hypothetical protein [Yersinia enterocolitica]HEB9655842.1 hypothetical protein [Yersinia enterocolitica]
MSDYPKYVPDEFIRYYEFDLIQDMEKEVANKMIFDEKMYFAWGVLSSRANECRIPYFFYQSLVYTIIEISKGPSGWDLLTQKEKETKIKRISNLSSQLSEEINGTPLDVTLTEYFNHKFYFDWFKEHNRDEIAVNRMNYYLDTHCGKNDNYYVNGDNIGIGVASAWHAVGVSGPSVSDMLTDLHTNAKAFESVSILKRKVNPNRSFFVRRLSSFFEESFNLKLYGLTAIISSVFLEEDISQEEVISMTR